MDRIRISLLWLPVVLILTPLASLATTPNAQWEAVIDRGIQHQKEGRIRQAEQSYLQAIKIAEHEGAASRSLATSLNNLGVLFLYQGKSVQAEALLRRALALRQKTLGPEHPAVAQGMNNLAALYNSEGKSEAAEKLYRSALAIEEKALRSTRLTRSGDLNQLSLLYTEHGKSVEAEPLMSRALALQRKMPPSRSSTAGRSLQSYVLLLRAAGRDQEAQQAAARANRSPPAAGSRTH